jgi:hypothetical protein
VWIVNDTGKRQVHLTANKNGSGLAIFNAAGNRLATLRKEGRKPLPGRPSPTNLTSQKASNFAGSF